MNADSSRYLQDYYDSQDTFSYLNSEEYFKDLKKVFDEPTKSRVDKLKNKIKTSLKKDVKKTIKQLKVEAPRVKTLLEILKIKKTQEILN